jgi:hypothetical protein
MKRLLVLCLFAVLGGPAMAQTCAMPIDINVNLGPYNVSNNSCYSQDNVPSIDYGSLYTPGRDVVYRVIAPNSRIRQVPKMSFTLWPSSSYDAAIFAVTQCSQPFPMISGDDSYGPGGPETIVVPAQPHSYYFIVDSANQYSPFGDCGQFNLYAAIAR